MAMLQVLKPRLAAESNVAAEDPIP